MVEQTGQKIIPEICMFYERNGECHALPYEPGVGIVSDPSLVEFHTGGPNFLVNRDAWCKARHSTTNWKEKKVSQELVDSQATCSRYQKGSPRTEDGKYFSETGKTT